MKTSGLVGYDLTLRVNGEEIIYSLHDALKFQQEHEECNSIDVINVCVEEEMARKQPQDPLEYCMSHSLFSCTSLLDYDNVELFNCVNALNLFQDKSTDHMQFENLYGVEEKSEKVEEVEEHIPLKELPSHLTYAFLGDGKKFPVIVSSSLSDVELNKLLVVLREYKSVLGWFLADLKGISPSVCMHRILMEETSKPCVQHQRRLNPVMQEVVRKEVIKWLDHGIIFPISDSEWVSPTQVVSKKGGVTVVKNEITSEVIATRVVNGGEVAGVSFDPRKAKAALIRNSVFRFIQKAGAHSAFERHETGTVQAAELFMIWCGVRGESMDIGSYVVEHLGRASNKKKGILTCGGVITAIALHCEVDFSEWEMVPGGMTLGMQELMKTQFIKIDNRGRGFFLQKDETHFPMPKKNLTTVDGWTDRANWEMISEIHKSTIEASLPVLPFRSTAVAIQVERPEMEGHVGETSQTPDDMEELSEPSQSRRRRRPLSQLDRLELLEHRMTSMEDRMTSMDGALQGIQGEVAQFNANLSSVNENVTLMLQLMQQWGVRFPLPLQ